MKLIKLFKIIINNFLYLNKQHNNQILKLQNWIKRNQNQIKKKKD